MGSTIIEKWFYIFFLAGTLILSGCGGKISDNIPMAGRKPVIEPDYDEVTIPPNIAPMNFIIKEDGSHFRIIITSENSDERVDLKSSDGVVRFREKSWRKLVSSAKGGKIELRIYSVKGGKALTGFEPVYMNVSNDPVDPYLAYRLIYPGYYSWSHIRIMQRSVESFREEPIFDNQVMEKNCANCHSFNRNNSDRFLMHIRGSLGGTYFVENGTITRTDPKIDAMPGSATYPAWNPDGRFIAFSSNQVRQGFYSLPEKAIEVFDLVSSLVIYDRQKNEIITVTDSDTTKYLLTFPSWSPDGKYLYFCRSLPHKSSTGPEFDDIIDTHYDLARKSFDPDTRTFGEAELVFDATAINKSASFPRISPDGKFLVFTLHDYGTFPIWHREADLYLLELQTGRCEKMSLNSNETDSYHTWSLNGRWLVFSSKRLDGRSARPFIAHIDSLGNQGKPFVLPQKDPSLYERMLESFNIPEFVNGRIDINPRDFAKASRQTALKSGQGDKPGTIQAVSGTKANIPVVDKERPIHE